VLEQISDDDWHHVMQQSINGEGGRWLPAVPCRAETGSAEPDFETIVMRLLSGGIDGGDHSGSRDEL
jgi:hypothetical protein